VWVYLYAYHISEKKKEKTVEKQDYEGLVMARVEARACSLGQKL
jgi:hypothetical protein